MAAINEMPTKRRTTYFFGGRMSIALMSLLTMVCGFAMYVTGRTNPFLRSTRIRKPKACILYDRPPRTGSATIARALDDCLTPKGWGGVKRYKGVPDHKIIQRMLDRRLKTALYSRQIFLTRRSVNLIHGQCTRFVFITSARPMKDRLLSKLKVTLRSNVDKKLLADGGNITIEEFKKEVRKRVKPIRSTEKYYEKLPTLYGGVEIKPNYVIRSQSFESDLQKLLKAFRCPPVFQHTVEDNVTEVLLPEHLSAIKLEQGDQKYINLTRIGEERNAETIEIISSTLAGQ